MFKTCIYNFGILIFFSVLCYYARAYSRRVRVGIDYGPRTIGIAYSDYFNNIKPHGIIANNGNLTEISHQIIRLAESWGASELILGIPLDSNGLLSYKIRNFNGRLCLNFSQVLSATASQYYNNRRFSILLCDERYTTKEAKVRLRTERIKGMHIIYLEKCVII